MRSAILAFLFSASIAIPQSRPKTAQLFVPAAPGDHTQLPEAPDLRARFGKNKLEVTSIQPAAAMLATHTVVVLDFLHASRDLHAQMLRDLLEARERMPEMNWFVLALGESPKILEFPNLAPDKYPAFILPERRYLQQANSKPSQPGKFQFYWIRNSRENPILSVANIFTARNAPLRVLWVSDDFTWFVRQVTCDPESCWTLRNIEMRGDPATQVRAELSARGMSIFPVLFSSPDSSDGPSRIFIKALRNLNSAKNIASETGGFVCKAKSSGKGYGLLQALEETSSGYHVRLLAKFDPPHSDDHIRIDSRAIPGLRYRREFKLVERAPDSPTTPEFTKALRAIRLPSAAAQATVGCPNTSGKDQGLWLHVPGTQFEEVGVMLWYLDGLVTVEKATLFPFGVSSGVRGACIGLKGDAAQLGKLVVYFSDQNEFGLIEFPSR